MKLSEFRILIREEITRILTEIEFKKSGAGKRGNSWQYATTFKTAAGTEVNCIFDQENPGENYEFVISVWPKTKGGFTTSNSAKSAYQPEDVNNIVNKSFKVVVEFIQQYKDELPGILFNLSGDISKTNDTVEAELYNYILQNKAKIIPAGWSVVKTSASKKQLTIKNDSIEPMVKGKPKLKDAAMLALQKKVASLLKSMSRKNDTDSGVYTGEVTVDGRQKFLVQLSTEMIDLLETLNLTPKDIEIFDSYDDDGYVFALANTTTDKPDLLSNPSWRFKF
jgi:hypothetical protein